MTIAVKRFSFLTFLLLVCVIGGPSFLYLDFVLMVCGGTRSTGRYLIPHMPLVPCLGSVLKLRFKGSHLGIPYGERSHSTIVHIQTSCKPFLYHIHRSLSGSRLSSYPISFLVSTEPSQNPGPAQAPATSLPYHSSAGTQIPLLYPVQLYG